MLKKYTAKSDISINVSVDGTSRHISFSPVTLGGSVFYTNDEKLQKALEHHYRYGHLFRGEVQVEEKPKKAAPKPVKEEGPKVIEVSCVDDAKEYLCEHFNDSRTKLRSLAAIKRSAANHNIRFSGEDFK